MERMRPKKHGKNGRTFKGGKKRSSKKATPLLQLTEKMYVAMGAAGKRNAQNRQAKRELNRTPQVNALGNRTGRNKKKRNFWGTTITGNFNRNGSGDYKLINGEGKAIPPGTIKKTKNANLGSPTSSLRGYNNPRIRKNWDQRPNR